MRIRVTWNKPDGTKPTFDWRVNASNPNKDDEEVQINEALAASQVEFRNKFGESPVRNQLSTQVIKD